MSHVEKEITLDDFARKHMIGVYHDVANLARKFALSLPEGIDAKEALSRFADAMDKVK
jgi:hypothetical protein